jgi:hypothetical protein
MGIGTSRSEGSRRDARVARGLRPIASATAAPSDPHADAASCPGPPDQARSGARMTPGSIGRRPYGNCNRRRWTSPPGLRFRRFLKYHHFLRNYPRFRSRCRRSQLDRQSPSLRRSLPSGHRSPARPRCSSSRLIPARPRCLWSHPSRSRHRNPWSHPSQWRFPIPWSRGIPKGEGSLSGR